MSPFTATKNKPRPLEGIRVVECGVWHAGPGGAAILADLGAEVIKIEAFGGDPERTQGRSLGTVTFGGVEKKDWTLLFEISNRNKKGICLDVASPEGQEILKRLVASADIFLTNLRKTTIPKLGLDYDSIKAANPEIIHVSASGFGAEGPMSEYGGFDPMGQAVSGMVFLAGRDEPVVLQTFILDQLTAITISHAAQTALLVRERHGHGQAVHVSLYGSAIWMLYCNLITTSVMGKNPQTKWDRTLNPPLRNCYKCKDGEWLMGTNHPEHKYWSLFCETIGASDLLDNPKYQTTKDRTACARELVATLDTIMLGKTRDEWLKIFNERGLLFCPVQRIDEVVTDPQAFINGYMIDVDHPTLGKVRIPGYPVQFSENETCTGPAPEHGEHTDSVLGEIGYSPSEIAELKTKGVAK